jgi:hypothetical protein
LDYHIDGYGRYDFDTVRKGLSATRPIYPSKGMLGLTGWNLVKIPVYGFLTAS